MATDQAGLTAEALRLYERYGKPLERKHWGECVAIFQDGRTVLGMSPHEVLDKAVETIGSGGFVFKLGEQAVWQLR